MPGGDPGEVVGISDRDQSGGSKVRPYLNWVNELKIYNLGCSSRKSLRVFTRLAVSLRQQSVVKVAPAVHDWLLEKTGGLTRCIPGDCRERSHGEVLGRQCPVGCLCAGCPGRNALHWPTRACPRSKENASRLVVSLTAAFDSSAHPDQMFEPRPILLAWTVHRLLFVEGRPIRAVNSHLPASKCDCHPLGCAA